MTNAVASAFLRPGRSNDIFDWVTAIFGKPWGPHENPQLIPPTNDIHILLYDVDADDSASGGVLGYFFAKDNFIQSQDSAHPAVAASNERLLLYLDSVLLAAQDEEDREANGYFRRKALLALAHEFQHMVHFYQKTVVAGGVAEIWLDEMTSMFVEDLLAEKLGVNGPRGVAYGDGTAGAVKNDRGLLPRYNAWNDSQVTAWHGELADYAVYYAFGAYLARNYDGPGLFRRIVRSDDSGVHAIEAALRQNGARVSFGEVLTDWAIANLLSDSTGAPFPYRYNAGNWRMFDVRGTTFRLGSINLFNYLYQGWQEGPIVYSVDQLSGRRTQVAHSNIYVSVGRRSGIVRLSATVPAGTRIAVVVKEWTESDE